MIDADMRTEEFNFKNSELFCVRPNGRKDDEPLRGRGGQSRQNKTSEQWWHQIHLTHFRSNRQNRNSYESEKRNAQVKIQQFKNEDPKSRADDFGS